MRNHDIANSKDRELFHNVQRPMEMDGSQSSGNSHRLAALPPYVMPLIAIVWAAMGAAEASAQTGSLLGSPANRRPLTLSDTSWIYQPAPEPKVWKLNDSITVVIDEKTHMKSEGQVDRRKKAEGALALNDWIAVDGFGISPDPQTQGDPKIAGITDNKYRAQANLENKDNFTTSIQCQVVDIRPNGMLVIEGHDKIQFDEEEWELSVSGIINPEDILPNKTVKSEKITEKRILRRSAGHGRDGIRRGWLLKWLDKYQPF
jgi:flagellar L-ring protein precursor FlgH